MRTRSVHVYASRMLSQPLQLSRATRQSQCYDTVLLDSVVPRSAQPTDRAIDTRRAMHYDGRRRCDDMTQPNLTAHAALRDGRPVDIRPLQATDVEPLAPFFVGLSAETRRRYAPASLRSGDRAQLCAGIGADPCTRFVVVLEAQPAHPAIIGYLILTPARRRATSSGMAGDCAPNAARASPRPSPTPSRTRASARSLGGTCSPAPGRWACSSCS